MGYGSRGQRPKGCILYQVPEKGYFIVRHANCKDGGFPIVYKLSGVYCLRVDLNTLRISKIGRVSFSSQYPIEQTGIKREVPWSEQPIVIYNRTTKKIFDHYFNKTIECMKEL